jgi:hypothetical protein
LHQVESQILTTMGRRKESSLNMTFTTLIIEN